ncbi:hypothetical protein [Kitasatospora sp. NPDC097643]|uniref:hypothetical protein n=1 Tax=Kitasatospora sp. NPDC097643 TaxID=3157230 RepID=UPI003321CFAD
MRIHLTRDSVAAGDDVDAPHARTLTVPDGLDLAAVCAALGLPRPTLPLIGGGRASWILRAADGTALAVLAQQWPEPRPLPAGRGPLARLVTGTGARLVTGTGPEDTVRLHVEYRRQLDPDAEYDRLAAAG